MRKILVKYCLIGCGVVSVGLAILGAVLPLLPTTPFLLLAAACFARSSPDFHRKLLENRYFGEDLQRWERDKSISRKAKIKAMALISLTMSVSIITLSGRTYLQMALLVFAAVLLTLLWRAKEQGTAEINH